VDTTQECIRNVWQVTAEQAGVEGLALIAATVEDAACFAVGAWIPA
jgi:hypothetical protein